MKTLVTPIGSSKDEFISFLVKEGISPEDTIVILALEDGLDGGTDEILKDAMDLLGSVSEEMDFDEKLLEDCSFEGLTEDISELVKGARGEIVINISSPLDSMTAALTAVSIFHSDIIARAYVKDRSSDGIKRVDLPCAFLEATENEKRLLKTVVEDGPLLYKELTDRLELSKSTVSRLGKKLEERGWIRLKERGKKIEASAGLTGKLVHDILK